jgi:hypothetical protein
MGAPVVHQAVETRTLGIAINTALSEAIDLGGRKLVAIVMPSGWDAASLTFQASPDGVTYYNVYDSATERSLTVDVSRFLHVDMEDWLGVRFLKLRSGTAATPVDQTAARTFTLIIQP